MIVKSLCAAEFAESTRRASGVEPLLAPPVSLSTFDPGALEGADLLYLDLHGAPAVGYWYGDGHISACSAAQVARAKLGGCVVFACNCYLADANSPMLDALLAAGAEYVVSGAGENFGGARKLLGAAELGYHFRKALEIGRSVPDALAWAKGLIRLQLLAETVIGDQAAANALADTLQFRAYTRQVAA